MIGFCTLAVGDKKYYKLAANLLRSYRLNSDEGVPFAIYCDEENEYTAEFDKVIILENSNRNYLDKIQILSHPAYDGNIFIDADCLIYKNINYLWEYFKNLDGLRVIGKELPLDSKDGWFEIGDIGNYKDLVSFIPSFHGGVFYFSDTQKTKRITEIIKDINDRYSEFKFKYFSSPADEPLIALAIAVTNCKPVLEKSSCISTVFLPTVKKVKKNIDKQKLDFISSDGSVSTGAILHFQNLNTEKLTYLFDEICLNEENSVKRKTELIKCTIRFTGKSIKRIILKINNKLKKD